MLTLPELLRVKDDELGELKDEIRSLREILKRQDEVLNQAKEALDEISKYTIPNTKEQLQIKMRSMKSRAITAWKDVRRVQLYASDEGNYFCESCESYFSGKPDYTSNCWFCSSTNVFEALEE